MGAYGSKRFKADLEALRRNDPTLTVLNYDQAGIGDEGARALAEALRGNNTLKRLRLGQCGLSALGLQRICRALCDTSVTACRLRRLELCTTSSTPPLGNAVGDNGAKCLAALLTRCSSLRHLNASGCGIGDEGAISIAKALVKNKTLKTLDLSYNSISDIGAEELGTALCRNGSLLGLSLWSNRVFHSGAEALANGLAANTTLTWLGLGCNHIGDEGVKAIAIALISNARESSLAWLALGGNQITDRGAEHLGVALRAQHSREKRHKASRVSGVSETDGPFEDDDVVESVPSQTSLQERIRGGALRPMLELGVTPSHISMLLEEHEGEEAVDGDEGGEEGEGGRGEGEGETGADREEFCVPLESLGLGGNKISDSGAQHLSSGLSSNTRLLSLGLADNCIGDEGASSLADLLRQTGTLQRLLLSGNEVADEGGSKLVAALTQNNSLKALYLAGNPLGDEVARRCLEVIGRHNNTLETLDLHDTGMTTPTINTLVESMHKEGVLRSLGSQALPVGVASQAEPHLPPSGNVLEVENWRPKKYDPILRSTNKRFTTAAPSNRQTTLEALGSLPAPVETAQSLVVKAGREREGTLKRRRDSVSNFFKKRLSISRGGASNRGSHVAEKMSETGGSHRASWRPGSAESGRAGPRQVWRGVGGEGEMEEGGRLARRLGRGMSGSGGFTSGKRISRVPIELQPLIEDPTDETDTGMFRSPTMVVGESDFSTTGMEHVRQTSMELGHIREDSDTEHNRQSSVELGPSENGLEPGPHGGGMGWGHDRMGLGTEGMGMGLGSKGMGMGPGSEGMGMGPGSEGMGMGLGSKGMGMGLGSKGMGMGLGTEGMGMGLGSEGMGMMESDQMEQRRSPRDSLLDSVQRRSLLHHLTTDRPKPPAHRRPPSRERSPSPSPTPSPAHTSHITTYNPLLEEEEEEGGEGAGEEGREVFHYDAANRMIASATPIHTAEERLRKPSMDNKPLKEQWSVALRKRVGILKMGGFLHSGFDSISTDHSASHNYTIARLPRNASKCRRNAPLPPTHSRVKLQLVFEEVGSDFINASYLGRPAFPHEFIVTQLPLENTVSDFWRMVWEQRVSVVMVIGGVGEGGEVWPGNGEEQKHPLVVNSNWEHEALVVAGIKKYPGTIPTLTVHQFSLTSTVDGETDYVTLYHYTGWPEGGVAESSHDVASLVRLLLLARQQQTVAAPVCVLSLHGGGRAGCVCAVGNAYELMTDPNPEPECWEQDPNILNQVIQGQRAGRAGLVGTQRQFEFLHRVLEELVWGTEGGEETDGGKTRNKKKKAKKKKEEKKEQKREKKAAKRGKSKKATGGEGGGGGGGREREGRESLLEGEDPVWTEQLHSQMMY